jgi:hypothetical protein
VLTTRPSAATVVLTIALAVSTSAAGVKIKTHQDETFTFRGLRTWAWHPGGAGDVKMAVTDKGDPAAVRRAFEPTIIDAVASELGQRGWVAAEGAADLQVMYYLLISAGASTQTMGQFLPATMEWGLPPLTGATTAFKMIEQGSIVLDVSAPSLKSVVWRGIAQAEIDRERNEEQRHARIRQAIRDMVKKMPRNR